MSKVENGELLFDLLIMVLRALATLSSWWLLKLYLSRGGDTTDGVTRMGLRLDPATFFYL